MQLSLGSVWLSTSRLQLPYSRARVNCTELSHNALPSMKKHLRFTVQLATGPTMPGKDLPECHTGHKQIECHSKRPGLNFTPRVHLPGTH